MMREGAPREMDKEMIIKADAMIEKVIIKATLKEMLIARLQELMIKVMIIKSQLTLIIQERKQGKHHQQPQPRSMS